MWTYKQAQVLVNTLQQPSRAYGYHLCLGGGVLNKGRSAKDLDLYFLPLDNEQTPCPVGLLAWLGAEVGSSEEIPLGSDGKGNPYTSHYVWKRKFAYGGRRIDIFVTP